MENVAAILIPEACRGYFVDRLQAFSLKNLLSFFQTKKATMNSIRN